MGGPVQDLALDDRQKKRPPIIDRSLTLNQLK
jgi:hypothetical protein